MKYIAKFSSKTCRLILNIINIILILITLINLIYLLTTKILKLDYPKFLDLTYFNIKKENEFIPKGNFIIVDLNTSINNNDLIIYKNNNEYKPEKVIEIEEEYITIKEEQIKKEQVVGKVITIIPLLGSLFNQIIKPIILIGCIILIIFLNILQNLINKVIERQTQKKPNFSQKY